MAGPEYHARTHLPGGTDPVTFPSITWATAIQFSTSISKSGAYYRPKFTDLTTNDTDGYELGGVAGGLASWLQINKGGYYQGWFGVVVDPISGSWGANDTFLEPIMNDGGDVRIDTDTDFSDFTGSDYNRSNQFFSEDVHSPDDYRGLFQPLTFHWDPDGSTGGAMSLLDPLQIAVRVLSARTTAISMVTQVHVQRLCDPGYTHTEA